MTVGGGRARRPVNLAPEDAALVGWAGDGYPPALAPLLSRLARSGISTLDVNPGWWPLVMKLDAEVAAVAPEYRIARLGEDLGVLDFAVYPDDVEEDIEGMISGAQSESTRRCEICADRAWPWRQEDWLITLCVDHARSRGARPARTDADIAEAVPRGTDREMAFAISAGVPASAFTARARRENDAYLHASAEADDAEMSTWLTSTAVARLLSLAVAEVNELRRRGELYAGRRQNGRYMYPRWQLDQQNRPLRGLAVVLAALGDDDPVSISNLMTAPDEELDGLSIARWLTAGGDPNRAVASLRDAEMF